MLNSLWLHMCIELKARFSFDRNTYVVVDDVRVSASKQHEFITSSHVELLSQLTESVSRTAVDELAADAVSRANAIIPAVTSIASVPTDTNSPR